MAKKKAKKGSNKNKKNKVAQKTSEDIFLEELTVIVEARLKEQWAQMDAGRKLTKKDKARLAHRRQEELRVAVIKERQRLIEEEKIRQEQERLAAIEKEKRDKREQEQRVVLLQESIKNIKKLQSKFLKSEKRDIELKEWEQYLKCDGLPNPSNCGEMNTFLHLWNLVREETSMEDAIEKTGQVIILLDTLEEFIDCPAIDIKQRQDWITIRNTFREYQQYNLDCAAYKLLRDIDNKLNRLDIPTAVYVCTHEVFTICLWALIQLPIPTPNPKKPRRPQTHLEFPELNCELLFPESIDVWALCVRVMYVNYDNFSHLCLNALQPDIPNELLMDLNEATRIEWIEKTKAIIEVREQTKKDLEEEIKMAYQNYQEKSTNPEMLKIYNETCRKRDNYVKVDASQIYCSIEDQLYMTYRSQMEITLKTFAVNLRRYRILGGVFYINLFFQPPQPTTMVLNEISLTTLQLPKWLLEVPFSYKYTPPPPPEPGVTRQPEEIEEEIKKQEEEYSNMILVNLSLPTTVLWLDVPIVCQWSTDNNHWTTKHVHDVKHNEEKQTIQFRTGKFGPVAMAIYRYNSMPFQAWELKPMSNGTIQFTIMAAVLIIEFTVSKGYVCVSQLQNAPNEALDHILGKYYKLPKLKRILQQGGVDFFPEADAFCYIEGACEKQWPVEHHLYYNMAQISLFYNFAWSRWNLLAGRRKIVMQMREWSCSERAKISNYLMLLVTPIKAQFIECTEVSQTFNEEPIPKSKFAPDLHHLIMAPLPATVRRKIEKSSAETVNTIAHLLIATRVASLS